MGCLSSKPATEPETETPGVALVQVQGAILAETGGSPVTLADLAVTLADLDQAFKSMKNDMNDRITTEIGSLKTSVDSNTTEIGSLKTSVDSNTTEIGSLKTSINSNTNAIESNTTEIGFLKTSVDSIKTALLVPDGDAEAKQSTVTITLHVTRTSYYRPLGHGIVVKAPDHSNANDERVSKYYLLSAAHVLIAIAADMKMTEGTCLQLRWWHNRSTAFQENAKGALILHTDYISMGSHDYGFMELKSMTNESLPRHASMQSLRLHTPTVGHSVVAHGRVFLRGTVTGQVDTTPRFSVMAHSIPGSSGAPTFNNLRDLVAVVHGRSKHRGHANRSMEDDDAAVAYVDTIQVTQGLYEISENHWNWLSLAEEIPPEVASGQEELDLKSHKEISDLWTALNTMGHQGMGEVTLEVIMDSLKREVVGGGIKTSWDGNSEFKFVCVPDPSSTE